MGYSKLSEKLSEENWRDDSAPTEGQTVRVLCRDKCGTYEIPFPVEFREDDWFNPSTRKPLADEVYIVGWRPWNDGRGA